MFKKLMAVTSIALGLAVAAGAALPASATTTINLWAIDANNGQLYSIDPATGASTLAGSGVGVGGVIGAARDPKSDSTYLLTSGCELFTIDLDSASTNYGLATATGVTLSGNNENGDAIDYCDSFTIDKNGLGHLSAQASSDSYSAWYGTFSLTTGVISSKGGVYHNYFDWMAFNPKTGVLYGQDDSSSELYTVNLTTGVETSLGVQLAPYAYSVVFDSTGAWYANDWNDLWQSTSTEWVGTDLGSFGISNGTNAMFTSSNVFPVEKSATSGKKLASTGSFGQLQAGIAALALAAGAAFVAAGRRRATK